VVRVTIARCAKERIINTSIERRLAADAAPMQPIDWALLFVPGVIWGSSFFLIAEAMESFSPGMVTPLRVLFGFITLSLMPGSRKPVERATWKPIMVLGLVWLVAPLTMFPFAEQHVSSSVIGMLNGGMPMFAAAVAAVITRRLPHGGQVLGIAIGMSGIVLIALPTLREGSSSAFGVMLVVFALMMYGIAINIASPLQQRFGTLPILWRAELVALVLLAPMGFLAIKNSDFEWVPFFALLVLGVFGTAVAHMMAATMAGRVGPTRASASTYVMPAVALFLGVVVRGESVSPLALIGSVIAVIGAWVLGRSRRG
jgi:drug/metabolite transporter (DMT)-like permease